MESSNKNQNIIIKENIFNRLLSFSLINKELLKHQKLSAKLLNHSGIILEFFRNQISGKPTENPTQDLNELLDAGIKKFSEKPFISSDTKEEKYKQRMAYVSLLKEMKNMLANNGIESLFDQYVNMKWQGAGGVADAMQEYKSKKK